MAKRTTLPAHSAGLTGFPLECSSGAQGFEIELADRNEQAAWLEREIAYWSGTEFAAPQNDGGPAVSISSWYVDRLRSLNASMASDLQQYLERADRFGVVVGQSRFGEALLRLRHSDPSGAALLVASLTESMENDLAFMGLDYRRAIRASLMVAPAMLAAEGLAGIASRERRASLLVAQMEEVSGRLTSDVQRVARKFSQDHAAHAAWMDERQAHLTDFVAETETDLTRIKELYHKHIQTEAAATYWNDRAKSAWRAGVGSLMAFVVLVGAPLVVAYLNIAPLKDFVLEIGTTPGGQLSLTPIVAITVPVLVYAWILRHISRLFIQSFTQADDARYRNVMTMTFLGLTKDKSSGVTDAERGIIMNALFRPTPPSTAEDGPPTGLIDLIKGVKN